MQWAIEEGPTPGLWEERTKREDGPLDHAALIVAAGRGTRAGGRLPKQYQRIGGQAMLERTILALLDVDGLDAVQVVIHPDDTARYSAIADHIEDPRLLPPCPGADSRAGSVQAGLAALRPLAPRFVHIHDAARPFVPAAVVQRLMDAVENSDGAFPVIEVVDALWRGDAPVDRAGLVRAQTPQSFRFDAIVRAHEGADAGALDDVAVARAAGLTVTSVPGAEANFKITTPDDFRRAALQTQPVADVRTGTGFDVHAFAEGTSVTLAGVEIAHRRGLSGHSDADVAMHALTDAVYGALAEGDIGQWFPPSDPQWQGAASRIFLEHAVQRAAARGFVIQHLDCTIIAEAPKIGPHAQAMREALSSITGIAVARISVKATTSEKLGFTGREEGIAAMASATLVAL